MQLLLRGGLGELPIETVLSAAYRPSRVRGNPDSNMD